MIVIGVDTHKGSHALAAVDAGTGQVRGSREIKADEPGHLAAGRWARGLDDERVSAMRTVGRLTAVEQALLAAGERSLECRRTDGRFGKGEREPASRRDRRARGRARGRQGRGRAVPVAYLDERRWRSGSARHRGDLVAERTPHQPAAVASAGAVPRARALVAARALNQVRVLDRVDRQLRKLPAGARVRIAREQVAQLRSLGRQIDQLAAELAELVRAHRPQLLAEQGCGPVTAAILIGHTAGNERFRSEASFALQNGPRRSRAPPGSAPSIGSTAAEPPAQPRATRDRDQPRPTRPRDQGVPRSQGSRRQDEERSAPLSQAPPRTPLPPPPRRTSAHTQNDPRPTERLSPDPNEHDLDTVATTIVGVVPMPMPCAT